MFLFAKIVFLDMVFEEHSLLHASSHAAWVSNTITMLLTHLAFDSILEHSLIVLVTQDFLDKRRLAFLKVLKLLGQPSLFNSLDTLN